MPESREWMRTHTSEGFVVGRFTMIYEQEERELVALQTVDGIVVIPATAAIPVTSDYIVNQMALDLERVIRGMRAGGLTFAQVEQAWNQALSHIKQIDHGD
jgi:hypothetical protein